MIAQAIARAENSEKLALREFRREPHVAKLLNEPLEIEEEIKVDDDDGPELAARAANLQP